MRTKILRANLCPVQAHTGCIYYSYISNNNSKHTYGRRLKHTSPLDSVLQAPWRPKHCLTKAVSYFNCFACMLYNKAAADDSYSRKQEDHQHQFIYTQASYKDPGAILWKRNTRRSGSKYNAYNKVNARSCLYIITSQWWPVNDQDPKSKSFLRTVLQGTLVILLCIFI